VGTATLGAGFWGQLDLVGEGLEWNLDWNANSYVNPCTDCANLTPASNRVVRGAGYDGPTFRLLPPARFSGSPAGRSQFFGFRCSRTP
jgi:formylglycine-generating enzyme required for sulfatase activity